MNNGTKSANIMTWSSFKKKVKPQLYSTTDLLGGKQIVQPTMRNIGFTESILYDINEETKPIEIVKASLDVLLWTYIVCYVFKYRDGSGKGILIYYK